MFFSSQKFKHFYLNRRKKRNTEKNLLNSLINKKKIFFKLKKNFISKNNSIITLHKKKLEPFFFFSDYPKFKKKIVYFSGEIILRRFFTKNFYNFENIDVLFKILNTEKSQLYFFHIESKFSSKNAKKNFHVNRFYSPGWLYEFEKCLNYPRIEKKMNNEKVNKTGIQQFTQKKFFLCKNFLQKRKISFFIKIKSWNFLHFQLINSELSKISRQNKIHFLIKILEYSKFINFQKVSVLSFFEKSKYDSTRLNIYKFILGSFLTFKEDEYNYNDKNFFHFLKRYQKNHFVKIKNKENIYWHEAHIDITRKSLTENDKSRFFLFSKRKKEFLSETLFLLMLDLNFIHLNNLIQSFFQLYNTFFCGNQNFFSSWFFYLPFESIRKIIPEKKKKIQNFILKNLKNRIFESLRNIISKRGLFFLREILILL